MIAHTMAWTQTRNLLREEGVRFPTEKLKKEFWGYNADFLQEVALVYLENQHSVLESFPKGIDEDTRANKIISAFRLGFGEAEKRIVTGASKAGINKDRPDPSKAKGSRKGENPEELGGYQDEPNTWRVGDQATTGHQDLVTMHDLYGFDGAVCALISQLNSKNFNIFLNSFNPSQKGGWTKGGVSALANSFIRTKLLGLKHEGSKVRNEGVPWWADPEFNRDPAIVIMSRQERDDARWYAEEGTARRGRSPSRAGGSSSRDAPSRVSGPRSAGVMTEDQILNLVNDMRTHPNVCRNKTEQYLIDCVHVITRKHKEHDLTDNRTLNGPGTAPAYEEFRAQTSKINLVKLELLHKMAPRLWMAFTTSVEGRISRTSLNGHLGQDLTILTKSAHDIDISASEIERFVAVSKAMPEEVECRPCKYSLTRRHCFHGNRCPNLHVLWQ